MKQLITASLIVVIGLWSGRCSFGEEARPDCGRVEKWNGGAIANWQGIGLGPVRASRPDSDWIWDVAFPEPKESPDWSRRGERFLEQRGNVHYVSQGPFGPYVSFDDYSPNDVQLKIQIEIAQRERAANWTLQARLRELIGEFPGTEAAGLAEETLSRMRQSRKR